MVHQNRGPLPGLFGREGVRPAQTLDLGEAHEIEVMQPLDELLIPVGHCPGPIETIEELGQGARAERFRLRLRGRGVSHEICSGRKIGLSKYIGPWV